MLKKFNKHLILLLIISLFISCGDKGPTQPPVPPTPKPRGIYIGQMGAIAGVFSKPDCLFRVDFIFRITNTNNVGGTVKRADLIFYWQGKVLTTIYYTGSVAIPANHYVDFIGTSGIQSSCVKPGKLRLKLYIHDNNGYDTVLEGGPYTIPWN